MWRSFVDPVKQVTPQGEQSHGTERAWASGSFAKPAGTWTRETRLVPAPVTWRVCDTSTVEPSTPPIQISVQA